MLTLAHLFEIVAVAAFVALISLPAFAQTACDLHVPANKKREPTQPFKVSYVPGNSMSGHCHLLPDQNRFLAGCEIDGRPDSLIFISTDQTKRDQACALTYEKAHLSPNRWFDDVMESAVQQTN